MENIQKMFPNIEKKHILLFFKEWAVSELSFIVGNFKDWVGDETESCGEEKDELYYLLVHFEEDLNKLYTKYYNERKENVKSKNNIEPNMVEYVMALHNAIGYIADWFDNINPSNILYFTNIDDKKIISKFKKSLDKIEKNITKKHNEMDDEKDKLIEIYSEIYKI